MPQKASMNNNARKYNRYNEVDERILALFAENKEKAFRLLYDTYYLPLCLYSVQFTGSTETSEDIVQNLFVSFWDKNSHTTISSNLHAWLFNAVRFSSLTKVQRERYFSLDEMEEESYSPIDDFYDEEELLQKRNQLSLVFLFFRPALSAPAAPTELRRHRIQPAPSKRMTAQQTVDGQIGSLDGTVLFECLNGIV